MLSKVRYILSQGMQLQLLMRWSRLEGWKKRPLNKIEKYYLQEDHDTADDWIIESYA